jgi:hypothetical protein
MLGRAKRIKAVVLVILLTLLGGSAEARVSSLRWQRPTTVDSRNNGLVAISCPSVKLCVAVDGKGYVVTSTAPSTGARSWRRSSARIAVGAHGRVAIDCRSKGLCVVADETHDVFVSSRPAGGATSWMSVRVDASADVTSVSCPSRIVCIAVDSDGNILSTTSPTGGTAGWSTAHVDPAADDEQGGIYAVSCASTAFCAAVDDQGNVLSSSTPAGGASAWHIVPVYTGIGSAGGLLDISCPSPRLCAAVDGGAGEVATATDPRRDGTAWKGAAISPAGDFTAEGSLDFIRCEFTTLCVAADNLGHVYTSTHPTGGPSAWSTAEFGFTDVSCPSRSLCVAVSEFGSVRLGRTSTRRT